jgi:hypothetical protein
LLCNVLLILLFSIVLKILLRESHGWVLQQVLVSFTWQTLLKVFSIKMLFDQSYHFDSWCVFIWTRLNEFFNQCQCFCKPRSSALDFSSGSQHFIFIHLLFFCLFFCFCILNFVFFFNLSTENYHFDLINIIPIFIFLYFEFRFL